MARLKHSVTGVVVNVSDDKAATIGDAYVPADAPDAPAKTTRRTSTKASADETK